MNNYEEKIWEGLDILRTIDSQKYMEEILSLTFVRFLEDRDNKKYWSSINPDEDIKEQLVKMVNKIEEENPEVKGLVSKELLSRLKPDVFKVIRYAINRFDLTKENAPTIYGSLLNKLSELSGREYSLGITPNSINKLFAKLLDADKGDVYDGTVGSGQLLLEIGRRAKQEKEHLKLWGQEINESSYAIAKMNMMINDIPHELALGDTLYSPKFTDGNSLRTFDYVAMDFPFSMNWQSIDKDVIKYDKYGRFPYGIPPKTKADMLFIQHAISSLKPTGKAALLSSQGVLFHGGSTQKIRQKMIDSDLIEAIILLPSNLMHNTSIPTAILIFNKDKEEKRRGKIQLINTEELVKLTKARRGRVVSLNEDEIQSIKDVYTRFLEKKNISVILENKEIEEANLTFDHYSQFVEVEDVIGNVEVNKNQFERAFKKRVPLTEIGETYRGTSPITNQTENTEEFYVIQPSDVQDGGILVSDLKKTFVKTSQVKDYLVKAGDIVLTSRGKSIKMAIVPEVDKDIVLSQNMIGFRPKADKIDSNYLYMYLNSPIGMAYISIGQTSSATTILNRKSLETIPVPIIDRTKQEEIGLIKKNSESQLREAIRKAKNEYKENQKEIYAQAGLDVAFKITKN